MLIATWIVWTLIIAMVALAAALLYAIRLPTWVNRNEFYVDVPADDELVDDEPKIILVEDDKPRPTMALHDAARAIRAEHFGGDVEDTLSIGYVHELDEILTTDALVNGEKVYLEWVLTKPELVAEVEVFVNLDNWNLVRAMLEEDIDDAIDVDTAILFLKARKEHDGNENILTICTSA